MPKEENSKVSGDPLELWEQWYETTCKAWSQSVDGSNKAYVDPFAFYRTWAKIVENAQGQMQEQLKAGSFGITGGFSLHSLKNINVWSDAGVML